MNQNKSNTNWGPGNPHPLSRMKTELIWEGKYDEYGNSRPISLPTSPLPLQRIETIDEPRDREKASQLTMFDEAAFNKAAHRDDFRNMLIWGDNKLSMTALLEQFLQIQERVKKNKELAKRNAKHDYLLRGFIVSDKHSGKNGKPRHYCGKQTGSTWLYACPIGGFPHSTINGPGIEEEVKARTKFLISMPPHMFYEHFGSRKSKDELQLNLRGEIDKLQVKSNKNINAETELVGLRIRVGFF